LHTPEVLDLNDKPTILSELYLYEFQLNTVVSGIRHSDVQLHVFLTNTLSVAPAVALSIWAALMRVDSQEMWLLPIDVWDKSILKLFNCIVLTAMIV
jgi:hypothetical protein